MFQRSLAVRGLDIIRSRSLLNAKYCVWFDRGWLIVNNIIFIFVGRHLAIYVDTMEYWEVVVLTVSGGTRLGESRRVVSVRQSIGAFHIRPQMRLQMIEWPCVSSELFFFFAIRQN